MSVPDFQTLMLPFLKILGDGYSHSFSEMTERLAAEFRLTDEERRELLPSGRQAKFDNRLGWASTYLRKAGLIENVGRGNYQITDRGLQVLGTNIEHISIRFLLQFPEFQEFRTKSRIPEYSDDVETAEQSQTPEEALELHYQNLRSSLSLELLERVKSCSPRFFEQLVVDLLVSMGYGGSRQDAGQAVGQTGDDGIDGIIKEDKLGLDAIYIQAKLWRNGSVGRPVVQAFVGSLEGHKAKKGILITTSHFTADAKEYVNRIEKKIVLIDGELLTQLMIDYGLGVTNKAVYTVKRIDEDYFSGE